jgi:hypothetical protein
MPSSPPTTCPSPLQANANPWKNRLRQPGSALTEYILIGAGILVVCISALTMLGGSIVGLTQQVSGNIQQVSDNPALQIPKGGSTNPQPSTGKDGPLTARGSGSPAPGAASGSNSASGQDLPIDSATTDPIQTVGSNGNTRHGQIITNPQKEAPSTSTSQPAPEEVVIIPPPVINKLPIFTPKGSTTACNPGQHLDANDNCTD